jgi:hypothetical protein
VSDAKATASNGGIGVFLAGLWAYGEVQERRAARRKAVRP